MTASSDPREIPRRDSAGRHGRSIALFLTASVLVLGVDLLVKSLAFARVAGEPVDVAAATGAADLPRHPPLVLVPRVLSLKLMLNRGAAFGLGQGGVWAFVGIGVVAIAIIGGVFWRSDRRAWVLHTALALLLAGALGNLYDRVRFGQVRDMLWLFPDVRLPFGLRWPGGSDQLYPWIFNVADAAMCVGLVVLLVVMYRGRRPADEARPAGDDA